MENLTPEPAEQSQMSQLAQRVAHLKQNSETFLITLQGNALEARKIVAKADNTRDATTSRYNQNLLSDIAKYLTKSNKVVKILERMAIEATTNDEELHKFVDQLDSMKSQFDEIKDWACRFKLTEEEPKAKRRRQKSADEAKR